MSKLRHYTALAQKYSNARLVGNNDDQSDLNTEYFDTKFRKVMSIKGVIRNQSLYKDTHEIVTNDDGSQYVRAKADGKRSKHIRLDKYS